jgi:hypothetical protein
LRRPLILIAVGAVLLIGAAAGFVIAPQNAPGTVTGFSSNGWGEPLLDSSATGWPRTTYDAALVAMWALLIVGALTTAVGLIGYVRRPHNADTASHTQP